MSRKFKPTKITPEVFDEIKSEMDNTCLSREFIMMGYDIGHETYRLIKKSNSYKDYQKLVKRKTQLAKQRNALKLKKAKQMRKSKVGTEIVRIIECEYPQKGFDVKPAVQLLAVVFVILLALLIGAKLGGLQ